MLVSVETEIKHAQTGQLLFTISGKLTSHSEFGHDAAGKEVFEVKPKKGCTSARALLSLALRSR